MGMTDPAPENPSDTHDRLLSTIPLICVCVCWCIECPPRSRSVTLFSVYACAWQTHNSMYGTEPRKPRSRSGVATRRAETHWTRNASRVSFNEVFIFFYLLKTLFSSKVLHVRCDQTRLYRGRFLHPYFTLTYRTWITDRSPVIRVDKEVG